jgi:Asp-tRNA(Asn)/Glu-tRNA(Gln) amidotransferase A subunit family amidase
MEPEQVEAAAQALPAGDQSLAGARLRGLGMSHPDWIRASRLRGRLRARWLALFQDVDVVLCPPMPTAVFRTIFGRKTSARSMSTPRRSPVTTRSPGPGSRP